MNLESRLTESLNDILRSSGYIFEIINKNKKQSNLITGSNNQLIPPVVTAQLGNSISKFDDVLDETISKFNDARWCVEQMLESKQKQEELKLKEEEKKREEEEKRKLLEEKRIRDEEQRKLEEQKRKRDEEEKKKRDEQERQRKLEQESQKKQQEEEEKKRQQEAAQDKGDKDLFGDFISPDFDFNINDMMGGNNDINAISNSNNSNNDNDIPNPSDILSSIDYPGFDDPPKPADTQGDKDMDLDINNILGNNDSILDGLNMSLLDQGDMDDNQQGTNMEEDFDVDNFLNQFAGND